VFLCCFTYFCVLLRIVCFVTFSVLFFVYMCTELLPPGGYPIAVKYVISCVSNSITFGEWGRETSSKNVLLTGVLVICVLVFTVFWYCFIYVYLFLFVTSVRTTATARKLHCSK
jgi:hypothetical protein